MAASGDNRSFLANSGVISKKKGHLQHRGQYGSFGRDAADDVFFFEITPEYGVILTSKYIYITTRFKAMNRNECLCGASELMAKNIGAWNEKVGHPWSKQSCK